MCSLTENDYGEPVEYMETKKTETLVGVKCKKCQQQKAEVILRVKDTYCRNCFLDSFTHKFRATLGKSKMIKPNENILIGLSGSQSSFAMLQLVKDGREIISPKRLQCIPSVIFIDEGAALVQTEEQRNGILKDIVRLLLTYGIPGYVTSLDRGLDCNPLQPICHPIDETSSLIINKEGDLKIKELFSQLKTLSSKEDLLQKLRCKVLLRAAESLHCTKVFVGDCATDLAVTIMSNLSLGRGAHLTLDVGFCDFRNSKVSILRPMRDFTKKEIAYFSVFKNIESVHFPSLSTKADPFSSIQRLTEKFIIELQDEFPSTVSTIFRTADKLSVEGVGADCGACILCQAPFDTSKSTSSSLQATEFSQLISSSQLNVPEKPVPSTNLNHLPLTNSVARPTCDDTAPTKCCTTEKHCACGEKEKSQILEYQQVKSYLCYGCRLIVKEMDSLEHLPSEVIQFAKTEMIHTQLRKEIQDFLL